MNVPPGTEPLAGENDTIPGTEPEELVREQVAPDEPAARVGEPIDLQGGESQRDDAASRATAATAPLTVNEDTGAPLDDYDEGEAETLLDGWSIGDLDSATWAAEKLHHLELRRALYKKIRDDRRARLDAWFDAETRKLDRDRVFFTGRLESFHRMMLERDPRNAITVDLPDGTRLSSQAGKLAVEVTDAAAFVAWCEVNELTDTMLRYADPEPQKAAIGKVLGAKAAEQTEPGSYNAFSPTTGEAVPGIEIIRRPRSYTIKGPVE